MHKIRPDHMAIEKRENCKLTNVQVLSLLVMFPFFVVRNTYRYLGSSLGRLFNCEKNKFCRFMNDGNVRDCRLIIFVYNGKAGAKMCQGQSLMPTNTRRIKRQALNYIKCINKSHNE